MDRKYTHEDCPDCEALGYARIVDRYGKPTTAVKRCVRCGGRGMIRTVAPADEEVDAARSKLAAMLDDLDTLP